MKYKIRELSQEEVTRIPFFNDLSGYEIEMLSKILNLYAFPANHYVFNEGDRPDSLYFIMEGSVKVLKNVGQKNEAPQVLAELLSPQIFGETAILNSASRSASILVTSELLAVELSNFNFEKLIRTEPEIAVNIVRKIASTLSLRLRE